MDKDKFKGLLEITGEKTKTATTTKKSDNGAARRQSTNNSMPAAKAQTSQSAAEQPEVEIRPRTGRPAGKRSSSDYKQVTAYIDLATYKKVKVRLFEQDEKQEFSELVDKLLKDWLLK
jgi:sRNA-binding protein